MATNAYLLIEGVTGPSKIVKNSIEIFSFSWGVHNAVGIGMGSGERRAGKAQVSDLTIMKALDKTSKDIVEHCFRSDAFTKVTMGYLKQISGENQEYFHLILSNTYITSYQLSGSSENPTESVSISFEEIEFGYSAEKPDGKGLEGFKQTKYNVLANVKK